MNEKTPVPSADLTQQQINEVCRPPALRFSKEMIEMANRKFEGYAPFWCPIIAGMTLQNILIVSLMENFQVGSEDGLKAINMFFDKVKFEVANQWKSKQLEEKFANKKLKVIS